ncbi:hypothetical protein CYMTET_42053 [Cymbomonas tetramitiformis]|uniref:Uncharacterized protein n=1 Tax=Cymbomonas tetramitiformis TaxID=36881 RepID=A0AAE0F1X2_9CHLO|nr:hypothetical protein CYMTET_42053 [Cymbomonas tetramitiformis]
MSAEGLSASVLKAEDGPHSENFVIEPSKSMPILHQVEDVKYARARTLERMRRKPSAFANANTMLDFEPTSSTFSPTKQLTPILRAALGPETNLRNAHTSQGQQRFPPGRPKSSDSGAAAFEQNEGEFENKFPLLSLKAPLLSITPKINTPSVETKRYPQAVPKRRPCTLKVCKDKGIQASPSPWTRYYFPDVSQDPCNSNPAFRHFDVLDHERGADQSSQSVFLEENLPTEAQEAWTRLFYQPLLDAPATYDSAGPKETGNVWPKIYHASSIIPDPKEGNIILDEAVSARKVDIEAFCLLVTKLKPRTVDDFRPLADLRAGLLTYLSQQMVDASNMLSARQREREKVLQLEFTMQLSALSEGIKDRMPAGFKDGHHIESMIQSVKTSVNSSLHQGSEANMRISDIRKKLQRYTAMEVEIVQLKEDKVDLEQELKRQAKEFREAEVEKQAHTKRLMLRIDLLEQRREEQEAAEQERIATAAAMAEAEAAKQAALDEVVKIQCQEEEGDPRMPPAGANRRPRWRKAGKMASTAGAVRMMPSPIKARPSRPSRLSTGSRTSRASRTSESFDEFEEEELIGRGELMRNVFRNAIKSILTRIRMRKAVDRLALQQVGLGDTICKLERELDDVNAEKDKALYMYDMLLNPTVPPVPAGAETTSLTPVILPDQDHVVMELEMMDARLANMTLEHSAMQKEIAAKTEEVVKIKHRLKSTSAAFNVVLRKAKEKSAEQDATLAAVYENMQVLSVHVDDEGSKDLHQITKQLRQASATNVQAMEMQTKVKGMMDAAVEQSVEDVESQVDAMRSLNARVAGVEAVMATSITHAKTLMHEEQARSKEAQGTFEENMEEYRRTQLKDITAELESLRLEKGELEEKLRTADKEVQEMQLKLQSTANTRSPGKGRAGAHKQASVPTPGGDVEDLHEEVNEEEGQARGAQFTKVKQQNRKIAMAMGDTLKMQKSYLSTVTSAEALASLKAKIVCKFKSIATSSAPPAPNTVDAAALPPSVGQAPPAPGTADAAALPPSVGQAPPAPGTADVAALPPSVGQAPPAPGTADAAALPPSVGQAPPAPGTADVAALPPSVGQAPPAPGTADKAALPPSVGQAPPAPGTADAAALPPSVGQAPPAPGTADKAALPPSVGQAPPKPTASTMEQRVQDEQVQEIVDHIDMISSLFSEMQQAEKDKSQAEHDAKSSLADTEKDLSAIRKKASEGMLKGGAGTDKGVWPIINGLYELISTSLSVLK